MVTCQSANQLKTPAKVSWAFKMLSQFGSLGYTITGKTADLTVVQKTIIDTLHKEGKPQHSLPKKLAVQQWRLQGGATATPKMTLATPLAPPTREFF